MPPPIEPIMGRVSGSSNILIILTRSWSTKGHSVAQVFLEKGDWARAPVGAELSWTLGWILGSPGLAILININ